MSPVMSSVYITDYIASPDIEKHILGDRLSPNLHEKIEVLLVWHEEIDREYIDSLPNLKGIIRYGVGFDNIDIKHASSKGIYVCNTPDYGTEEVADTTMAMLLSFTRAIVHYDVLARQLSGNSWQENTRKGLKRLSTQSLGIIGCGRIGSAVAIRAKAFGLKVAFYDPFQPSGYEKTLGVSRTDSLESLQEHSDIISLHLPLNESTQSLIDEKFITNLKPGAILLNTSRGRILKNIDLLYQPLKENHLFAVGLDVLPEEPPTSGKLIDAWKKQEPWLSGRLIINPHTAYYTDHAYEEMRKKTALNALRVLHGQIPKNVLNEYAHC